MSKTQTNAEHSQASAGRIMSLARDIAHEADETALEEVIVYLQEHLAHRRLGTDRRFWKEMVDDRLRALEKRLDALGVEVHGDVHEVREIFSADVRLEPVSTPPQPGDPIDAHLLRAAGLTPMQVFQHRNKRQLSARASRLFPRGHKNTNPLT